MCAGTSNINCSNFNTYYDNEPFRKYFLDELFDRNTPNPAFSMRTNIVQNLYQEGDGQNYYTDWEIFAFKDGVQLEDTQDYFSFEKSSPSNITLSQNRPLEDGYALLVRRFEIMDYQLCDNIKATANINMDGLGEGGFFMVGLSLRERISKDSLNRFFIRNIVETRNTNYPNYSHEVYCISDRTDIVSVSFHIQSPIPCKMTIDNLHVDLLN